MCQPTVAPEKLRPDEGIGPYAGPSNRFVGAHLCVRPRADTQVGPYVLYRALNFFTVSSLGVTYMVL